MSERDTPRTFALVASPPATLRLPDGSGTRISQGKLTDTRGRSLRDLRISVTDRCNFRFNDS